MAVYDAIWTGATDGDWNTAGNWFPANVPTASENILITGAVDIDGATVGVVIGNVYVRNYTGTIGADGNPLDFANGFANDSVFEFSSTGLAYIDVDSSDTPDIDNAPLITVYKTSSGSTTIPYGLNLQGVDIQRLTVYGGSVSVGGDIGTTATTCEMKNVTVYGGKCKLDTNAQASSGALTLNVYGGELLLDMETTNAINDMNIHGGTVIKNCATTNTLADMYGGTYYHNNGTLTAGNIRNATVDFSQSTLARTITNLTVYRGGGWIDSGSASNLTFTNDPTFDTSTQRRVTYR